MFSSRNFNESGTVDMIQRSTHNETTSSCFSNNNLQQYNDNSYNANLASR